MDSIYSVYLGIFLPNQIRHTGYIQKLMNRCLWKKNIDVHAFHLHLSWWIVMYPSEGVSKMCAPMTEMDALKARCLTE